MNTSTLNQRINQQKKQMYYLHVKIIEMGLYIFISNCKLKTSESYNPSY